MQQVLQLNEKVIRLNAFSTVLLASIALIYDNIWIFVFLLFDFSIRGFSNRISPLSFLSKWISNLLRLTFIPVYAPPKKFAAKVGFIFSGIIILLQISELNVIYVLVCTLLIVCAFLEAFLKICVGCYIFDWIAVPLINKRNKVE